MDKSYFDILYTFLGTLNNAQKLLVKFILSLQA